MAWIYRDIDQHKCKLPNLDKTAYPGDVWQCDDCQTCYTVHDDQRDGPYMSKSSQPEIAAAHSRARTS